MKVETKKELQTPLKKIKTIHKATISQDDVNLIMDILAKLYTHPETAVVREYVANAVDAHIKANVKVPVEVTLPTNSKPILTVKDYGEGLDMHDILAIYGNFGVSDKRNSNDFIGGFGIGSKSGLAVSDKIYVESIKDGLQNIFELKRTSEGVITEFLSENVPVQGMKSGTTITVNYNKEINTYNMCEFINTLAGWSKNDVIATYQYSSLSYINKYNNDINLRIPDTWTDIGPAYIENKINIQSNRMDFIYPDIYDYADLRNHVYQYTSDDYIFNPHLAVVGNVVYPLKINSSIITNDINSQLTKENKDLIPNDILHQPLVLKFDIGEVKLPYSREYIDIKDNIKVIANAYYKTYQKIKDKVNNIKKLDLSISEYLTKVHDEGIVLLECKYYDKLQTLNNIVMDYLPTTVEDKIHYKDIDSLNTEFTTNISPKYCYNISLYSSDLKRDVLKPIKLNISSFYHHTEILNSILFINDIGDISEVKLRNILRSSLTSKKLYKNNSSFADILESILDKCRIYNNEKTIAIVPKNVCDECDIKSFYYTVNLSDLLAYTHMSTKTRKKAKTNYIEGYVLTTTSEWSAKSTNISKIYTNKKKDATPILDKLKEQKVLLFKPEQNRLFNILDNYFIDLNIFDICICPSSDKPYNFLKDNLPTAKIFDENMLKDVYTTLLEGKWINQSTINDVYDRNLLLTNYDYKNDIDVIVNEFDEQDVEPVLVPRNEQYDFSKYLSKLSPGWLKNYFNQIEELTKTDEFCKNALSGIDPSKYDVKTKEPSINSRLFKLIVKDSYWARNTLDKDDIIEIYKNFKAEYKDELKLAREFYRRFY